MGGILYNYIVYESYLNCPRRWKSLLVFQRNCSDLKENSSRLHYGFIWIFSFDGGLNTTYFQFSWWYPISNFIHLWYFLSQDMTTHIFEASNISLDRPMVLLCDMDRLLVLLNPARLPTVKSINLVNVFSYLYCNKCKCFDHLNLY